MSERSGRDERRYLPEEEIGVGHEVGDALEHATRLEDECGKRDLGEIHADAVEGSVQREGRAEGVVGTGAHRSWEMRDMMMLPSFSSLRKVNVSGSGGFVARATASMVDGDGDGMGC